VVVRAVFPRDPVAGIAVNKAAQKIRPERVLYRTCPASPPI
jgi:hypothetical protein